MLASLKSDYYLLRGYFKTLFGVFAFMIVMSMLQKNPYFMSFYPAFMSVYMPFTLFSLSEQSGWETMLLSAPVSRHGLVAGRYMMCLATDFVMLLIGFAATMAMAPKDFSDNFHALLLTIALVLVLNALLLPIVYKFGVTRARFAIMAVCLFPALIMPLFEMIGSDASLLTTASALLNSSLFLCMLIICAFLLLGLSYLVSCAVYKRKEF